MNTPSEKALSLAEELLDYVHPGMSRAAAIEELAEMIDDADADLVAAAVSLVNAAERAGAGPHTAAIRQLREALRGHHPIRTDFDPQHELFQSATVSSNGAVPGQMP